MANDPNSSDEKIDPDISFVITARMSVTTTGMEGDWDSIPTAEMAGKKDSIRIPILPCRVNLRLSRAFGKI